MLIKRLADREPILANDGCRLKELLHPRNDGVDLPYSIAIAEVGPGEQTHPHRLKQAEVYYLLAGSGVMHIGAEERPLAPGDLVLIPPGETQWIENLGINPLVFAALVSPPWRAEDDERLG
jgi:mannose-6-phosphate isomerase-like protein (cupin superfamily)